MKEMVMVPKEVLEILNRMNINSNPYAKAEIGLDVEMKNILNSDAPDDEKISSYNRSLEKSMVFSDKQQQQQPATVFVNNPLDYITSEPAKNRAKGLLKLLQEKTPVTWSQSGEIFINDAPIRNSNISDIIHALTKPGYQSNQEPTGMREVMDELQKANAPNLLFGGVLKNKKTLAKPPTPPTRGIVMVKKKSAAIGRLKRNKKAQKKIYTRISPVKTRSVTKSWLGVED